ncbi:hypothetical protein [Bradyrhizobium sp.]|uniref:hypothetical protein n=1 Tax=Bradyrhizobium sp. TaxID=376 RepID=UPI0025C6DFA7|nr:hypothetical protein [Bradyrhizobium sp.]
MQSLRKIASRARTQTRVALFGNNHSLRVNMRYAAYEGAARRSWKPRSKATAEQLAAASRFKTDGFAALPPPTRMTAEKLQAIKELVDRRFEQQNNGYVVNYGMSRLIDGLELVPEIIDFIDDDLEAVIENYYGSHFKIFAVSFYRTMPTPDKPDSSFLWHLDNCPKQEIKLMVYLDDVVADTGALSVKDKPFSVGLRKEGFFDRRRINQFVDRLDDRATTRVLEGPAGTRLLFENGGCIHKATSPKRAHRDVATFVLIPSEIPWRPHFARSRNLLSTNAGICIDPFRDQPEHVGYQY